MLKLRWEHQTAALSPVGDDKPHVGPYQIVLRHSGAVLVQIVGIRVESSRLMSGCRIGDAQIKRAATRTLARGVCDHASH